MWHYTWGCATFSFVNGGLLFNKILKYEILLKYSYSCTLNIFEKVYIHKTQWRWSLKHKYNSLSNDNNDNLKRNNSVITQWRNCFIFFTSKIINTWKKRQQIQK